MRALTVRKCWCCGNTRANFSGELCETRRDADIHYQPLLRSAVKWRIPRSYRSWMFTSEPERERPAKGAGRSRSGSLAHSEIEADCVTLNPFATSPQGVCSLLV